MEIYHHLTFTNRTPDRIYRAQPHRRHDLLCTPRRIQRRVRPHRMVRRPQAYEPASQGIQGRVRPASHRDRVRRETSVPPHADVRTERHVPRTDTNAETQEQHLNSNHEN